MTKWDKRFLGLSLYYSTFSKDPSTKVGCVLVDDFNTPVGLGYNGFSRESNDSNEILNNRDEKYPRTIHAEENAIFNSTKSVRGTTAYITHAPCIPCINRLSQNGIKHVTFLVSGSENFNKRWPSATSIKEMEELNITHTQVNASPEVVHDLFSSLFETLNNYT